MRLAISNIAWDVEEDGHVAALLRQHAVDAIDIAPGKYFPNPVQARRDEVMQVKSWWAERDIEITGMQSLLFGTTGLNVFGTQESRNAMRRHLEAVFRIAGFLGAKRLVFGSPRNRDRTGLDDEQATEIAAGFFLQLGQRAHEEGVILCLEPNPVRYGSNFMTTSEETANVVHRTAHPAVKMQFDTGAMTINGEDPHTVASVYANLIGHVHASEPDLVPLGDGATDHHRVRDALSASLGDSLVTIEMVATKSEPHLVSMDRALRAASVAYRLATA